MAKHSELLDKMLNQKRVRITQEFREYWGSCKGDYIQDYTKTNMRYLIFAIIFNSSVLHSQELDTTEIYSFEIIDSLGSQGGHYPFFLQIVHFQGDWWIVGDYMYIKAYKLLPSNNEEEPTWPDSSRYHRFYFTKKP